MNILPWIRHAPLRQERSRRHPVDGCGDWRRIHLLISFPCKGFSGKVLEAGTGSEGVCKVVEVF
ncbi:MAG: hypothetical protein JW863_15195 [Chitinispirillaceae bacterium]|nr:hypothetical protein [Chitinispirillaceae bacterium]